MNNSASSELRLQQLVQRLQPIVPVKIILFGSAARGQADAQSDLDVIVVADKVPERFLDRIEQAYGLIDHDYALDILVYTRHEYEAMKLDGNSLIETAEREGRVLYERSAA